MNSMVRAEQGGRYYSLAKKSPSLCQLALVNLTGTIKAKTGYVTMVTMFQLFMHAIACV